MPKFEWDENKNAKNKAKHGMPFEDAKDIFNDQDRLIFEQERNGEKRFLTVGKAFLAIISLAYTLRGAVVRIISARRANKKERRAYLSKKLESQDDEN